MDVQYPIWLPQEAWLEYKSMRKKIKKPLTEYAEKLALNKLDGLRDNGHDPLEVLNQSIFNCYQGLYELKAKKAQLAEVFTEGPDPRTIPGHCKECGGGTRQIIDFWECKKCGNKTKERPE